MGEVHYCQPLPVGSLGLTAIRRDEEIRLVDESAADVKGVERPQGMTFETAQCLVEGILGEVTEISVGEVGLDSGFEASIIPRGKSTLTHQPAEGRNHLRHDEDADSEGVRRGTQGPHLLGPLFLDIAFGQRRGVEEDPHRFSSRSARISSLRLRPVRDSWVWGGFFQAGVAPLTGTISATGRPLR